MTFLNVRYQACEWVNARIGLILIFLIGSGPLNLQMTWDENQFSYRECQSIVDSYAYAIQTK